MIEPAIFWFRRDLRLSDNPGLAAAVASGRPLLPIYIFDDQTAGDWIEGGACRWWLHHSLASLRISLAELGARLILRQGEATAILASLAEEVGAAAIYCNRHEEPWAWQQQKNLAAELRRSGRSLVAGHSALLFETQAITNQAGQNFRVFSPFWRHCQAQPAPPLPLDPPDRINAFATRVTGLELADFRLLPFNPDWAGGLRAEWKPGESSALGKLDDFIAGALQFYADQRDRPDRPGTSALSPHLRFGEISPRQILHAVRQRAAPSHAADKYIAELGWREFSYHLLAHFPDLPTKPWRADFADFPWQDNEPHLSAWRRGQTGFPIVDAGMRQLWQTGWMHNRVRMVVASFLVKNLLVPWQRGADWFWDTLVDADLASNSASWQWAAGCGADAAPFFRIFNPVLQGEKFDPQGLYVRRWCPELKRLPDRWLHRPWEAPLDELARAGVRLGETYPRPLVDLAESRDRALAAFKTISKGGVD